jgi:hypothetical protein
MCKGISNMVIPAVPRLAAQPQEDESFELPKKFGINFSSNPSSTAEDALMQAVNPTGAEPHPLRVRAFFISSFLFMLSMLFYVGW